MNFKTTIVLIVLLAVVGLAVFFVEREPAKPEQTTEQQATGPEKPLLPDVKQDEITKVTVTPADGPATAFEKRGTEWRLTQPVQGKADTFEVGDFVRELANLKTRTQVGADVQAGVDKPRYRVEIGTSDGKTQKLSIGTRSEVGGFVYVKVNDNAKADVVPADLDRFLTKPAAEYRDMKLVDAQSPAINRVTIKRPKDEVVLQKEGADWKVAKPQPMPGDSQEIGDLVSAIVGLRAVEYVDQPQAPSAYQFNDPQLVVTYAEAGAPAASQPASAPASQPAPKQIVFGRYEDVLKKNVFASVNGTVVKVAASALDQLSKTPLDLRDRKVLDLSGDNVERIAVQRELSATSKPTSRPASKSDVVIARNNVPATRPATTQAATAPSEPPAKWVFAGTATTRGSVDPAKVDDLLFSLHPLRATRYLAALPTTRPADHYVLTVETKNPAGKHVVNVFGSPTGDGQAVAEYNGLAFEVPGTLVDRLKADFSHASAGSPGTVATSPETP